MRIRSSQPEASAIADTEAYQTLLARAQRRTGGVSADAIVRHVLEVTGGGDGPVQRDALDAVLRRCASAHSDDVQVVGRPRGRLTGLYRTRRRGSRARPYRTLLRRIDPIAGSCECADFLRNSLGLCKHLVAVLDDVASRRQRADKAHAAIPEATSWQWDPVRPLTGPGDWLARVRWVGGTPELRRNRTEAVAKMGSSMSEVGADGWTVTVPETSPRRFALVERLLAALQDGDGEPALHALLQEDRARLAREIENASRHKGLHQALHTLKQSLYPYQHEGVERFFVRGRLLLADDMGLGKTAQAIAACHALWHTGQVRRGLLVVPAALKPQWIREWQLFTDAPAQIVDGPPAQRRAAFDSCRRGFLVANYEQLIRDVDVVRNWTPDIR
jgi:SNF2-related domain